MRVPSALLLLACLWLVSLPVKLFLQQPSTATQAVLHLLPTAQAVLQLAVRGGATIAQPPVQVRMARRLRWPRRRVEPRREREGGRRVAKDPLLSQQRDTIRLVFSFRVGVLQTNLTLINSLRLEMDIFYAKSLSS